MQFNREHQQPRAVLQHLQHVLPAGAGHVAGALPEKVLYRQEADLIRGGRWKAGSGRGGILGAVLRRNKSTF